MAGGSRTRRMNRAGLKIYLRPFPASDGQFQVSTTGGIAPRWRRDGKELYYIAPDSTLMAVSIVTTGRAPEMGAPVALSTDRGSARSGTRAGDHPSRSEAREHQGPRRRHGEGAGLRPGEGARSDGARGFSRASLGEPVADDHLAGDDDRRRHDPWHGRLHGARAGEGPRRRQTRRHLGLRRRGARNADRPPVVRRRGHVRDVAAVLTRE